MSTASRPREQYVVDETGKRVAVLLDIAAYERLIEDLHDLAIVAERRDEPSITLADLRERLARPDAV
jgi:PHD/YefM family antitoxin component YafN of YafNO toxin-antitoxin module